MQSIQFLLVAFLAIVLPVAADTKNFFISPVSNSGINPVYTIGDDLLVLWVTSLDLFNVTFWQQSPVQQSAASKGNIYAKIHASDQVTNFTWAVQLYGFNLSYSNVSFLRVDPDGPDGFVSTYFNITEPKSTTTASAIASTATSTQGLNLATPRASSSASSSPASAPASPPSSAALTTTSKIALAVGVGIGVPILCALGALIWLKSRNSANSNNTPLQQTAGPPGVIQPAWPMIQQPHIGKSLHGENLKSAELHGSRCSNAHCELPGSPYK